MSKDKYESQILADTYINLHYGNPADQMPFMEGPVSATGFPQRCAIKLVQKCSELGTPMEKALDIGCSVGGASFELAKHFDEVLALDLSDQFLEIAQAIKDKGAFEYSLKEEGEIVSKKQIEIIDEHRTKVVFENADACCLPEEINGFDAVLLSNLLCRIPDPSKLIARLSMGDHALVKPGGVVLITTPFSWLPRINNKEKWLGGRNDQDGNPQWSVDGLKSSMKDSFKLLSEEDMPMLLRKHRRHYHYIVPLCTIWQRL